MKISKYTDYETIMINPAMLPFAVGLYINDNDELVVGNGNVNHNYWDVHTGNANHNYWDVHTGLEITNKAPDDVLNLECKYEPTTGADMAQC